MRGCWILSRRQRSSAVTISDPEFTSKASGNFAIMSILSFPVLMPLILVVIRLSKQAVDGLEWAGVGYNFIAILVALNVLTVALSFLLFPYLWRD